MLAQREPAEWVFVDDGSTDSTAVVLESLLDATPRAPGVTAKVVSHAQNRGRGAARNTGLAEASGELVAFVDADIRPDPGFLQALLAPLQSTAREESFVATVGKLYYPEGEGGRPLLPIPALIVARARKTIGWESN